MTVTTDHVQRLALRRSFLELARRYGNDARVWAVCSITGARTSVQSTKADYERCEQIARSIY